MLKCKFCKEEFKHVVNFLLHPCVIKRLEEHNKRISEQEPPKPPVNVKVEFAHGVTHYFPKVDALTFADFDEWLSSHDEKEKFYILENGGQKYYLNREFICAVTVREVTV